MSLSKKLIAQLDKYYPPCGPCAFCGHRDKRHRLWDVFIESPETAEFLAEDYNTPIKHIKLVRKIRPYKRDSYNGKNKINTGDG